MSTDIIFSGTTTQESTSQGSTSQGSTRTASSGGRAALAAEAAAVLERASAQEILHWAASTFGERFCVASSMSDGVLAHLAAQVVPGIDVLFVDTGYHFVETLGTRDAVGAVLPVNVVTLSPAISIREQEESFGRDLYARDPDLCCALRKVQPFAAGLAPYDAWASGIRREHGGGREVTPVVRYDAERQKLVVSPLARWTQADVDAYAAKHGVIVNPLRFDGYSSIGCWPCTRRTSSGGDTRSGRWPGSTKSECGIHS